MSIKDQLLDLATKRNSPSVTIAFNTHRSSPDNQKDVIQLKNLVKEAEERILKEYDKKEVLDVLEKLNQLPDELEVNKNLESLNIYLSKDTFEFIRTTWPLNQEGVWIDESFAIRPLIKEINRNKEYLVLYLTQKGVHLYEALNDSIVREIENDDFPYTEEAYNLSHLFSKGNRQSNQLKEFYNQVDKALIRANPEHALPCLVVSTDENYSLLLTVADVPSLYIGSVSTDFNSPTQKNEFMKLAWDCIKDKQHKERESYIAEMHEAVGKGQVITDLQEIYQAAIDGKGELLIVHQDFHQAVQMLDDRTFDIVEDPTENGAIDDITSTIAWEVITKKGKVFFTSQDEIKDIGKIVLKTRY
ncbi:hypothetical protein SAMN05443634_10738 [Chishuiella changwenlii]|jgi:hypothetical protein|uniref:Uncharacterized protein n=1 Tax=Chishuiella changwenlii TaxID=1434701 RepID=A0A1M6YUB6_9FLAO|nr:hypothetical protein [Chishuiella changwenlii]GGE88220.1 hypothetical protein GCM10010984_02440 [Chishuiella changwenlii]SHL21662.1 hypothetical protein SAMN05443634_10738 [Chishuiella changwenlii]